MNYLTLFHLNFLLWPWIFAKIFAQNLLKNLLKFSSYFWELNNFTPSFKSGLIAAIYNDIKVADESLELDENKIKENLIQQFFNSKI